MNIKPQNGKKMLPTMLKSRNLDYTITAKSKQKSEMPIYKWNNVLNRLFTQEEIQIAKYILNSVHAQTANKCTKTALSLRSSIRMASIRKQDNIGWQKFIKRTIYSHCCWEYKLVQQFWKSEFRFLKILKSAETSR